MIVHKLRAQLGLTQHQFAEWLGVGVASVSRWERGAEPSRLAMKQLTQLESEMHPDDSEAHETKEQQILLYLKKHKGVASLQEIKKLINYKRKGVRLPAVVGNLVSEGKISISENGEVDLI